MTSILIIAIIVRIGTGTSTGCSIILRSQNEVHQVRLLPALTFYHQKASSSGEISTSELSYIAHSWRRTYNRNRRCVKQKLLLAVLNWRFTTAPPNP